VMGTPIRIQFKEGENPYEANKNTRSPHQQPKRRRLLQHLKNKS